MPDTLALQTALGPLLLRPQQPADDGFLYGLFRSHAFSAAMPVEAAVQESLLRMQFRSQAATYRTAYPNARFDIVERETAPIGRLVLDDNPTHACIVDFALTPENRGRGLGPALIGALLDHLRATPRPVHCMVLCANHASLGMLRRCGFIPASEQGAHIMMQWRPPT